VNLGSSGEESWEAETRRPAGRRVSARTFSLLQLPVHFVCRRNSRNKGWLSLYRPRPVRISKSFSYIRSVFGLPIDISEKVAAWLQEKTRGHPYFLACICKYLIATAKQLETYWPAILDQLGCDKFCLDVSKLSAKELELVHQFATFG
jgi:hypothetical protein